MYSIQSIIGELLIWITKCVHQTLICFLPEPFFSFFVCVCVKMNFSKINSLKPRGTRTSSFCRKAHVEMTSLVFSRFLLGRRERPSLDGEIARGVPFIL